MDIELTSSQADGSWTWRAAGARQPRGLVSQALVPATAKVGDVLRVEVETELEGINVVALVPTRARGHEPQRIEIVPPKPEHFEGVTTSLVAKSERKGRDRRPGGFTRDDSRERPPRRPARLSTPPASRGERPPRRDQGAQEERPGAAAPSRRPSPTGEASNRRPRPIADRPERPVRQRPPRFIPKTVHRDALMDTLAVEQRPIAEQLAMGGIPAVRRALAEEQATARSEGRPATGGEAILAIAEQLQPAVREAMWIDRAESAVEALSTISLRDLRATVAGAAPRNDEGRTLITTLRAALEERISRLRIKWEEEIAHALGEGRVLQALRLSSKPPEPSTRFPAALVEPLAAAASQSLNPSVPSERWTALLEAAAESPIRRSIKPVGLPDDDNGTVRQAATVAAGRIPALARLLGLAMPPPPRPIAARRPPAPPSRPLRAVSAESPQSERTITSEVAGSVETAPVEEVAASSEPEPVPALDVTATEPEPEATETEATEPEATEPDSSDLEPPAGVPGGSEPRPSEDDVDASGTAADGELASGPGGATAFL